MRMHTGFALRFLNMCECAMVLKYLTSKHANVSWFCFTVPQHLRMYYGFVAKTVFCVNAFMFFSRFLLNRCAVTHVEEKYSKSTKLEVFVLISGPRDLGMSGSLKFM